MQKLLVTGGNRGIGKAIVRQLLDQGHSVVFTARKPEEGQAVVEELSRETGNDQLSFMQADLGDIASCYAFAQQVKDQHPDLSVLINNAGVWMPEKRLNGDQLEQTFMVNYLAPTILTQELFPVLKQNTPARIVQVNSALYQRGKVDLEKTPVGADFHPIKTYANSKTAGMLFHLHFAPQMSGSGVNMNAVHPGVINTGLGDSPKLLNRIVKVLKRFMKKPVYGAKAPVWLATSAEAADIHGHYYNEERDEPYNDYVKDTSRQQALMDYTENLLAKYRPAAQPS
ncbi:MAG: SDR family NAD(P)-dependent oxidoreductase [Bacteroidota bacterium]